jgi:hypothetical protein
VTIKLAVSPLGAGQHVGFRVDDSSVGRQCMIVCETAYGSWFGLLDSVAAARLAASQLP